MNDFRRNLTNRQRFEYGIYQLLDHFMGRENAFKKFEQRRRRFYKNLHASLKAQGEGRIMPIERRKDLSLKEFKEHYVRKGIPVVMEGAAKDWECVKKWSLQYFKDLHGNDEIVMASQENRNNFQMSTLADVIDNIRSGGSKYYRFYPLLARHPEHLKDFDYKWLLQHRQRFSILDAFQVFIGGKGTVSDLHHANLPNLFVQVYGEKSWVLYPHYYTMVIDPEPVGNAYRGAPYKLNGKAFDPFNPTYETPYTLFKYIDGYEVTLKPGDVLWNPPFYWHTVKNPTDSIGVGYRWVVPWYAFKISPLYMTLDAMATNPPIWKSYNMMRKDANLVYMAESGQLDAYLKKLAENDKNKTVQKAVV